MLLDFFQTKKEKKKCFVKKKGEGRSEQGRRKRERKKGYLEATSFCVPTDLLSVQ